MQSIPSRLRAAWLLPATALGALFFLPAADPGAALNAASPAQAVWLQAPGVAFLPAAAPPPAVLGLPRSVFPHQQAACSVNLQSTPNECSIGPGVTGNKCSAHAESDEICSALPDPVTTTGSARCSVGGRDRRGCSVLQPAVGTGIFGALCSTISNQPGSDVSCSIMAVGLNQKCSADNGAGPGGSTLETCSAHANAGQPTVCSVLDGGSVNRNFCSVKRPGGKFCSALKVGAECSIMLGERGTCTSFTGAGNNWCSAAQGATHCSVLGGPSGNPCVQP